VGVSFFHVGVGWILRECLDFFEKFFGGCCGAENLARRCGIGFAALQHGRAAWALPNCHAQKFNRLFNLLKQSE
jgi:hypothetical protein